MLCSVLLLYAYSLYSYLLPCSRGDVLLIMPPNGNKKSEVISLTGICRENTLSASRDFRDPRPTLLHSMNFDKSQICCILLKIWPLLESTSCVRNLLVVKFAIWQGRGRAERREAMVIVVGFGSGPLLHHKSQSRHFCAKANRYFQ